MQTDNSVPLLRRRRQLRPSTQRRAALARAAPFAAAITVGVIMIFMLSGRTNQIDPETTQQQGRTSTFLAGTLDADRMQNIGGPTSPEMGNMSPALPSLSPFPASPSPASPSPSVSGAPSFTPAPSTTVISNNVMDPSPTNSSEPEPSPSVESLPEESLEPSATPAPKRLSFWFAGL